MNIVSNYPQVPLSPANPATQSVRQENMVRDVIKQPTQTDSYPREPGLAKEHEAQRTQTKEPRQRLSNGSESSQGLTDNRSAPQGEIIEPTSGEDQSQQQNSDQQDRRGPQQETSPQEQNGQESSPAQEVQQERIEQQIIRDLQMRDREVRAHEEAHSSVGGQYAGAPQYDYDRGPGRQQYAVSGEVHIDVSPVAGDPRATIQKMRQVRAAALAPADPSGQDLKVAGEANRIIAEAQGQILREEGGDSRYRGGSRRLGSDESDTNSNVSIQGAEKAEDAEDLLTESVMSHRNQVILAAYQNSYQKSGSSMSLTA